MKVSLNWLRDYIDIPVGPEELGVVLTSLGLEVEGMEPIEAVKGGLKGVVVGEVKDCVKHPNADRLKLTRVDVGTGELLQIVCGAPNVATGQKVLVATEGTRLYPIKGDSFVINKSKIRGELSCGMICAEDEIGIGTDHAGIMVLPAVTKPGLPASEYFQFEDDIVFEIGLTPNRADAICHLGVAKDLAAYWSYHMNTDWKIKFPQRVDLSAVENKTDVRVEVLDPIGCPRYTGISFDGLKTEESPKWMQNRLRAIGVRPISNIVDITNYVLHEYGQPLHAFDREKIGGGKIIVECLPEGSKFISLDEKERRLSASDLMICDGNHSAMCIAGVFGGLHSGISDSSTKIFLESAHFNAVMLRKSSTAHNLRTDAAKVFEKGSDPGITLEALERAAFLLQEYAGAKPSSSLTDVKSVAIEPAEVRVRLSRVNTLIGAQMDESTLERIFKALAFEILSKEHTLYTLRIPTNKPDVTREADVIEEILRIFGFDNVVIPDQIRSSVNTRSWPDKRDIKSSISDILVSRGFYETMGLSLIPSSYYKSYDSLYNQLVFVNNTSNVQLDAMRPEMMFSMLNSIQYNQNRQQTDLHLFEHGKAYTARSSETYYESEIVSFAITGIENADNWKLPSRPVDFFRIKELALMLISRFGIRNIQFRESREQRFDYALECYVNDQLLSSFGKVHRKMLDLAEIRGDVFYGELFIEVLLKECRSNDIELEDISRFPSSRRDIAILIDNHLSFEDVEDLIRKNAGSMLKELHLFDVYKDKKQLGQGKKSYAFGLIFVDQEKSITDQALDKIMARIIQALKSELKAELR